MRHKAVQAPWWDRSLWRFARKRKDEEEMRMKKDVRGAR